MLIFAYRCQYMNLGDDDTIFCDLGLLSVVPSEYEIGLFEEEFLSDEKPKRFSVELPELCFFINREKHHFYLLHRHLDVFDAEANRFLTQNEIDYVAVKLTKICMMLGMEVFWEAELSN